MIEDIKIVRIQGESHLGVMENGMWHVLEEREVWRELTKNQRLSLESACIDTILVYGHPRTIKALERRGLVESESPVVATLTDAGRRLGEWALQR